MDASVARLREKAIALEAQGRYLPAHAVRYLDRFGHCGDPPLGFTLLRCGCGGFRVLPFTCKARGLCPTCGGRAMASGAAFGRYGAPLACTGVPPYLRLLAHMEGTSDRHISPRRAGPS